MLVEKFRQLENEIMDLKSNQKMETLKIDTLMKDNV